MPRSTADSPQLISTVQRLAVNWSALRVFNFYRLALAAFFAIGAGLYPDYPVFRQFGDTLFLGTALAYVLFGLAGAAAIHWRQPPFEVQVVAHVLADLVIIAILAHVSGGLGGGMAVLLMVAVAEGAVFFGRQAALAVAAVATLVVLGEQVFRFTAGRAELAEFTRVGLMGAAFFLVAAATNLLARQQRESEALASQRGADLANMAQLNEYIIQRIESGILVVDPRHRIRLMNETAWYLFNMPAKEDAQDVGQLSPELAEQLTEWRNNPDYEPHMFRVPNVVAKILPRFARLGQRENAGTLIFLDDSSVMTQQAQDLKLASLGRLTASIAHEIRNPLGAISHAGQLLDESPNLDEADKRLTRIIREQSLRMNTIIENVMQLSRRDRAVAEVLQLKPWLENFVDDFVRNQGVDPAEIETAIDPADTEVSMDTSHLSQVLFNLCQNALRHSPPAVRPKIKLHGGSTLESRGPFLDVIDFGPGVDPDLVGQIFEPFFTTDAAGTGLGLFIARELCESNQAHLEYIPVPTGGSCFRISFAGPKRRSQ